jgi:hypothetical protein
MSDAPMPADEASAHSATPGLERLIAAFTAITPQQVRERVVQAVLAVMEGRADD